MPIATVGGVVLAAICYILSSTAIMGMISNKELLVSAAPFADAARLALGNTAANIVALCAALGCLGSLAGWTLLVGQTAKAAADDGLFPAIFAKVNKRDVPATGLVIVAAIMSVLVLATMSPTASAQFGKIASIAVIMTLLPYIYSAVSIKVLGYKKMPDKQFNLYVLIGIVAAIYSMWAMVGSDGEQSRWALIFVVATIIFYELSLTRTRAMGKKGVVPGGRSPRWVDYCALALTILAMIVMFWVSVGKYGHLNLKTRSPAPTAAVTQTVNPPAQVAQPATLPTEGS